MTKIGKWLDFILTEKFHIDPDIAGILNTALLIAAMIFIGIGINWLVQSLFRWLSKHNIRLIRSKWHPFLVKRKLGHHILLLVSGLVLYVLPYIAFERGTDLIRLLHRIDIIYILIVIIIE